MSKWLSCILLVITCNISASTVKEGLALYNQKQFDEAKAIFEPLAEQGDARAMFWLGVTQFRTGEQFKASASLHEAAEAGDPWAMHLMVPSYNKWCSYLGWPCDEGWMDKTIAGWKKLADNGDGNAMYALLRWGDKPWWAYVPILKQKKYGKLVEEAVKAGGYKAAGFNAGIPLTIEKRVELLKYIASKNYAPAMMGLYFVNKNHMKLDLDVNELLKKMLFLGWGGQTLMFDLNKNLPPLKRSSDVEALSDQDKKLISDLYYYSLINKRITGDLYFKPYIDFRNEKNELVKVDLLTPNEQKRIEEKARKFLVDFKVNMFIDEASSVHALL
ncbi:tetratricopeptide repeat protein [Marinomonas sp. FW-1]|uniref:tetratricopeptide repeat protein n=1 Tax=Marinomonas sp. FW-1 TaxID=2071621 RepID=UPI0010BF86F0|nr:tetratricopeptide repeat protein [Marinomonas sp. FW-1]